jgi:hypothetical protein
MDPPDLFDQSSIILAFLPIGFVSKLSSTLPNCFLVVGKRDKEGVVV